MKKTTTTTYTCDYCGEDFTDEAECSTHELFCQTNPEHNLYQAILYTLFVYNDGTFHHERVTGMIRNKWTRCLGYHFVMDTDQSSVFPIPRILNWRDARQRLGEVIPIETCQGVAYCLYLEEPDDEGAWRAICNHILTLYATEMSKLTKKASDVSVYMDEVMSSLHTEDEEMADHQETHAENPDPDPEPEPEETP